MSHQCFVYAHTCPNPVTQQVDDGAGGKAWVCAHHAEEYEAWIELFEGLTPERRAALGKEITKHECSNSVLPEDHGK